MECLMPIKEKLEPDDNPRRITTGRRHSKTFRQFPKIIIHPPDETNLTSSMPNIHTMVIKEMNDIVINNVFDINASCPDLTDERIFNIPFDNSNLEIDVSIGSFDDFAENISVSSESSSYRDNSFGESRFRRSNSQSLTDTTNFFVKDPITSRQKPLSRPKKKDETPSEFLKRNWKEKHSSLHSLPSKPIEHNFDSYHTYHGGMNVSHNFSPLARTPTHSNEQVSSYCCHCFHGSLNRLETDYNHSPGCLSARSTSSLSPGNHTYTHFYTEFISKCCCGGANCKAVVPIHDYLETYLPKTVRYFKRLKTGKTSFEMFIVV